MTPTTLQALRRLLFFSRQEAALLVAAGEDRLNGVSDRTWRMWEDGARGIPRDVADNIRRLAAWRSAAIDGAHQQITQARKSLPTGTVLGIDLVWYETMSDWLTLAGRDPVLWRPQQSVVAAILAGIAGTRLVRFDGPAYSSWLDGRADSEAMRSAWAAE